ncbi:MAG: sensor histidine kinase [Provencibacterium sp.]|jgi:signal transduction histidine kinase|nr:sensor histidine kinase [Provencibacterium sp.]
MENGREPILANVEKLYGLSDQPAAVVDGALSIVWVNDAAAGRYEILRTPDGIHNLIPGEYAQRVAEALARGEAQAIAREQIPLFSASLCFTPLQQKPEEVLALVNFQPLPPGGIYSDSGGANRVIAAFSGNIRGPLGVIFATLSSLSRNAVIRRMPVLYRLLETISGQGYRILRHCVNLTAFARFSSALNKASLVSCDLVQTLEELCGSAQELTGDIGVPLTFSSECRTAFCLCDMEMLQTALFNILSNACRYTREGNAVQVTLKTKGGRALIRIADRGMGIPEDALPRIFEPFFSLADGNGEVGCGLGLTVAKMCMAAQNGSISVQSREGQGAAVALSLPLAPPSERPLLKAPAAMELLCDRFSTMYILLSDVCKTPSP